MTPFSLLISGYTAAMDVVCANDPPPMPDFSNFNPLDLIGGVFNPAFEPARAKLAAAFENWLWNRFCFCSTGALVTPPVTLVPPPAATSVTSSGNATPCFAGGWTGLPTQFVGGDIQVGSTIDITRLLVPIGPGRRQVVTSGVPYTAYEIPGGLSSITGSGFVPQNTIHLGSLDSAVLLQGFDTLGSFISQILFSTAGPGNTFSIMRSIPTNWLYWYAAAYNNIQVGDPSITLPTRISTQVFCGGNTSITLQSCCPPDPSLANMLQAILASIQTAPSGGGIPPGSYVDSVVHAGLHGNGTIRVQRQTVAVRAVITTDNNQLPVGAGEPPYLFNRGFIVPLVAGGAVRGNVRLVYNPQLYVLPQFTEQVGYTITESLVVSLIEMIAGP